MQYTPSVNPTSFVFFSVKQYFDYIKARHIRVLCFRFCSSYSASTFLVFFFPGRKGILQVSYTFFFLHCLRSLIGNSGSVLPQVVKQLQKRAPQKRGKTTPENCIGWFSAKQYDRKNTQNPQNRHYHFFFFRSFFLSLITEF